MLFDNDKFSPRQKEIIEKIGEERRVSIDKDKTKAILAYLGITIFLIILMAVLVILDKTYFGLAIFIGIASIVIFGLNILKKSNEFNQLKERSNYSIGLYYATSDSRVKGNANRYLRKQKISFLVISISFLFLFCLVFSISFFDKSIDFTQLEEVKGVVDESQYIEGSDKKIIITLLDDDVKYNVQGLYMGEFDWNIFTEETNKEHTLTLLYRPGNNSSIGYIYYAEINGIKLLSKEEVLKVDEDNKNFGWLLCGIFGIAFLGSIGLYLFYKQFIYKKNKAKEIWDLDFTEEEMQMNQKEEDIFKIKNLYIKTQYSKKGLYFLLSFSVIFLIGSILGFIFGDDPSSRLGIGITCLFLSLLGWFGVLELKYNYIILDGDYLIIRKLLSKEIIDINNIKRISYFGTYIVIYGNNRKVLCKMGINPKGSLQIVSALEGKGVLVDGEI